MKPDELDDLREKHFGRDDIDDEGIEIKFDADSTETEVEVKPQCQAETNGGEQCPNDAKHPPEDPVVCVNHCHKLGDLGGDDE